MTTPISGAPDWAASQATPWTTENEAKRYIEALSRRGIIEDRDLTAPPGTCADGACYLIAATATGAWATYDGKMAVAVGTNAASGWLFVTVATEGTDLYIRDENIEIRYNGSAWVDSSVSGAPFSFSVAASDQTTALVATNPAMTFEWPYGATLTGVYAFVNGAADSSGPVEIDVEADGATIFSTTITIDPLVKSSRSALIPAVISDANRTTGEVMEIRIVTAGDGATGLIVTFEGLRTA